MNYDEININFLNKTFIIFFIVIFMALYIFVSFIKFLGQLPILVLISYGITYLITQGKSKNKMNYSEESESVIESFKLF